MTFHASRSGHRQMPTIELVRAHVARPAGRLPHGPKTLGLSWALRGAGKRHPTSRVVCSETRETRATSRQLLPSLCPSTLGGGSGAQGHMHGADLAVRGLLRLHVAGPVRPTTQVVAECSSLRDRVPIGAIRYGSSRYSASQPVQAGSSCVHGSGTKVQKHESTMLESASTPCPPHCQEPHITAPRDTILTRRQ